MSESRTFECCPTGDERRRRAHEKKMSAYAAKFAAETVRYTDDPRWEEPTDDAFAEHFKCCVVPAPLVTYPHIREIFMIEYAEKIALFRSGFHVDRTGRRVDESAVGEK